MKKQLLIAAIAATMGTAVIADVAITGHAKYVYTNAETSGVTGSADSNAGEVNLVVDGSHGDTKLHIEQEFEMLGTDDLVDVEDVWMSTKVGDFGVKIGAWDGSTSAITGSILNNGRSTGKVSVTTSLADVNLGLKVLLLPQLLVVLNLNLKTLFKAILQFEFLVKLLVFHYHMRT